MHYKEIDPCGRINLNPMIYTVEKEVLPTIFVLFDVFHLFLPFVIIVQ